MKRLLFLLTVALLAVTALSATTVTRTQADGAYSLTAMYTENAQPGDALFVRLILTPIQKKGSKDAVSASAFEKSTVSIALYEKGLEAGSAKPLRKSAGYLINRGDAAEKKQSDVLLAGIPLSSYLKPGLYTLTVRYEPFGKKAEQLQLPVSIAPKEFVHETIPLDGKNTAIKTDISPERQDQIKRLNAILDTKNKDAVYALEAFVPPTPATRRTSFFADRRIYAYSGGGSSTSLHYGIDYGIPTGSEVRACSGGRVVMAENRVSTGWSVCIEHLPGLYSLYYHMSRLDVATGDMVSQGALLGLSGATGLATGPHLHWEVRLNTEAVSPDFFVSDFTFEQASKARANQ
ncbi:MAG: M23 family metallopeptidase [Treponema sp.]|nr:M23 family metallopeptidase [Treponema sp.]